MFRRADFVSDTTNTSHKSDDYQSNQPGWEEVKLSQFIYHNSAAKLSVVVLVMSAVIATGSPAFSSHEEGQNHANLLSITLSTAQLLQFYSSVLMNSCDILSLKPATG